MNTFCISQISPHFAVFVPLFPCFVDFLSLFPIFCVEFRAVNFLNFFPCICRFCRILLQIMQVCLQFFNFLLTFPASVKLQTVSRCFVESVGCVSTLFFSILCTKKGAVRLLFYGNSNVCPFSVICATRSRYSLLSGSAVSRSITEKSSQQCMGKAIFASNAFIIR